MSSIGNEAGSFVEATRSAGLHDPTRAYALGVIAADYDGDGDVDLYVANDTLPNFLSPERRPWTLPRSRSALGGCLQRHRRRRGRNGRRFRRSRWRRPSRPIVVTNFSHETNTLYDELWGRSFYRHATDEVGLGSRKPGPARLGYAILVDLDNDGDEDLFVANGHVYPRVAEADDSTTYRQKNQDFLELWRRRLRGRNGLAAEAKLASRGAALR